MNILELKNVNYNYAGTSRNVLVDVNAAFESGKIYAIIGKSGSGKSTMLSLIAGLDLARKGEILHNGHDLKKLDRDKYRAQGIGVVFQSYNLITNATALENIILSMNISGSKTKNKRFRAYEILESVGIDTETASRRVLKLSGGEQQRVGIARALSHGPDIIIADEPTGNLDNETEKDILDILIRLAHKENKCVIIVTHSKKVSAVADEILTMEKGMLKPMKG